MKSAPAKKSNGDSSPVVLVAEDDSDDRLLFTDACHGTRLAGHLRFVQNGVELMDDLHQCDQSAGAESAASPSLIVLDLNMPRKDGREALVEIKADPHLRLIPVIILTTSASEEDVAQSYERGAAGYITKPASFDGLQRVVQTIENYWFEIVRLPAGH